MSSKKDTGKGGMKIRQLLLERQVRKDCWGFVLARGAKRRNFFFRKGRLVPVEEQGARTARLEALVLYLFHSYYNYPSIMMR